jgi:hypothetical protein
MGIAIFISTAALVVAFAYRAGVADGRARAAAELSFRARRPGLRAVLEAADGDG